MLVETHKPRAVRFQLRLPDLGDDARSRAVSAIFPSHSAIHRPLQEASLSGFAVELIAFHDHPASR
jgi:hypothetical protein